MLSGPYPSFPFLHGASLRREIPCVNDNRQFRQRRTSMGKFIVEPHFRLQEWVAEEKGYFRDQELDYEFRELIRSTEGQHHNNDGKGPSQRIEHGRQAAVSSACHC